jgi:hypothetical protein
MLRNACPPLLAIAILGVALAQPACAAAPEQFDVVVYGGTSAGIAAAIQTARMGKSVVLIEPGKHLGGMTSGGLGATDIGNKAAIGGIAREFYQRVKRHYDHPSAWKQQQPGDYANRRNHAGDDAMWFFEPHVAETIFRAMLDEQHVVVALEQRLDLKSGVTKNGTQIAEIRMESGRAFRGKMFLDCTYEGDLMAHSGVRYHVGRESCATYGETLNGVQVAHATQHQLARGVDPYVVKGDKASGLLPGIAAASDRAGDGTGDDAPGKETAGDRRVQAYCFRMCVTDAAENRIPFAKPADYDERRYELLLRNFEAGESRAPWNPILMPNRKTDANNNYGVSTDDIGMNYAWPEGDYAARERIFNEHLSYQQGLMWTLANHPRVPEKIRREFSKWGNCRDEFAERGGWSHQIYVREARRMIGAYVMTQHDCQGRRQIDDSIGLAAYGMDSHHVQRYVDAAGFVRNEGDVQVAGFSPYPIAYRALTPKAEECTNLLVPVCLSASHIAYGSIRMEPVFMVLGQSAATAAALAIDGHAAVQAVDVKKLQALLAADHQVLAWQKPAGKNAAMNAKHFDPAALLAKHPGGIVLDDDALARRGDWKESSAVGPIVAARYWHDDNRGKGEKEARFTGRVAAAGKYEIRLAYAAHGNRATNVPVVVEHGAAGANRVKAQRANDWQDRQRVCLTRHDQARSGRRGPSLDLQRRHRRLRRRRRRLDRADEMKA